MSILDELNRHIRTSIKRSEGLEEILIKLKALDAKIDILHSRIFFWRTWAIVSTAIIVGKLLAQAF